MSFAFGVTIFALGILVSVCLHEAGHLITAKTFGMKATQYFAGFGPTLFSFRRGETEYGLKAVPAGGFVKIVGMTPLEKVAPEDEARSFWRFPLWQRTIVLVAGSATHFVLALMVFYAMALTTGLINPAAASFDALKAPAVLGQVTPCVVTSFDVTRDGALRTCKASDPKAPARIAGLKVGDRITQVGTTPITTYGDLVRAVRSAPAGPTPVTYLRGTTERTATVSLLATQRPALTDKTGKGKLTTVSAMGIGATYPTTLLHYNAASAAPASAWYLGVTVKQTFAALGQFPSKIPKLIDAIGGQERDPNTPISVVGASRVGGQAVEKGLPVIFLALLGGLNVFVGVFNLFPLLPLDGGHVAIAWFEKARTWLSARAGRPDPGRVDYNKLLPATYLVIAMFAGLTVLTLTADIVNPLSLQ